MKRASAIFSGSSRRLKTNSSSKGSSSRQVQSHPAHGHPPYTDPPEYRIRGQVLHEPFVTVRQLKGHLSLLDGFAELRKRVDSGSVVQGQWSNSMPKDLDSRWAWFIGVAVERFERWCEKLPAYITSFFVARDEVPPIEVLMVWHAYLLNPRCYADDAARHPMLHNLRGEFGNRLMAYILHNGKESFNEPPSLKRSENWRRTGLSWRPFGGNQLLNKIIECPGCSRNITVDLTNRKGDGYTQEFIAKCNATSTCRVRALNKRALGVHKLVKDLNNHSAKSYLAGTLYYTDTGRDCERAEAIKKRVYAKFAERLPLSELETTTPLTLEASVLEALAAAVEPRRYRIITSAYKDDKPFSLDLVGAVLRQYSFVKKMGGLGWATLGFFDDSENELVLRHAIARYHAFLDLMSSSLDAFLVPTLDIDLAWHTHQLLAIDYYNDCMASVGRFIDHDDKVEESTLSTAFETTCQAWRDRFGLPYAYCGCPIPGGTIGQRMSRLVLHYRESRTMQRLLTPMENRHDSRAATHPSDHNAVYAPDPGSNEVSRTWWKRKSTGPNKTYRERVEKKKWMMTSTRVGLDERCDNYPAFLTPVPYTRQDWSVAIPASSKGSRNGLTPRAAVATRRVTVSKRSTRRGRGRKSGDVTSTTTSSYGAAGGGGGGCGGGGCGGGD